MAGNQQPDKENVETLDQNHLYPFTGKASGMQLQQPLGAWTTDYQIYREWKWRMPMADCLLHQRSTMANPRVAILAKSKCRYLMFSLTIPTNQEFQGMPVTLHDAQNCTHANHEPTNTHPSNRASTEVIQSFVAQFHAQLEQPFNKQPPFLPIVKICRRNTNGPCTTLTMSTGL